MSHAIPENKNIVSLTPWERVVRRATQRQKIALNLDPKKLEEALGALSTQELYFFIKEHGLEATAHLLPIVGGQKIQAMLDFDIWQHDRSQPSDLLVWLETLHKQDRRAWAQAIQAIDPELLVLLLRRRLFLAFKPHPDIELDEPTPSWLEHAGPELEPLSVTPDGRYIFAARLFDELEPDEILEPEDREAILAQVSALYETQDHVWVRQMLEAARTDLSSGLEEEAYHFRCARLEDLGYPPLAEALSIYAPLSLAELQTQPPRALTPGGRTDLLLPSQLGPSLSTGSLRIILDQVPDLETAERIEVEMVALANAMVIADGIMPADMNELSSIALRMRAYLEWALESLVGDAENIDAVQCLIRHPMKDLFRVAHSKILALSTRCRSILAHPAFSSLEDVDSEAVRALTLRRPKYWDAEQQEVRPFLELSEFHLTEVRVQRAETVLGRTVV